MQHCMTATVNYLAYLLFYSKLNQLQLYTLRNSSSILQGH